jgi:glutamyl-tRNA synthetase
VELGRAYPCFCNEEDIAKTRAKQEQKKQKTGYYGEYAACKDLTLTDVRENLSSGKKWALRLDTSADEGRRISWKDCIKGDMTLPVEVNHPVVVKSNGIPPYNFAHVVDDTLMRTSHVIRGEEWLVSTAEHIQIFEALGLQHPNYAHPPVICIDDNGNKRKLSKRKDKEAVAENFLRVGYPVEAVTEYLMTLYNTDFEMWRIKNPKAKNTEFAFTFERIGSNSPLFDWNKVNDISKNVIAKMSCMEVNREAKAFFEKTLRDGAAEEKAAAEKVLGNFEKVCAVLAIDRETDKPRKDIVKYSDIVSLYDYIFSAPAVASNDIAAAYAKVYKDTDTKEEWFDRVKALASGLGYATSVKEYKQAAETFRGHVGDVAQAIRQSVTGRDNTPDLYAILKILGKEEVTKRLIGR